MTVGGAVTDVRGPADGSPRRPLRIAVLGPYRHPIRQPYAGGLEAVVAGEVAGLRRRGHEVLLFAAAGSEGHERAHEYPGELAAAGLGDVGYPPGGRERETREMHRVLDVVTGLGVDLVHNHALHPAPLERAGELGAPLVTTLHCPAFPEMAAPLAALGERAGTVLAVSRSVLGSWDAPASAAVLYNGVDTRTWTPDAAHGPRHGAVWVGRLVPEKAPHLAVEAADRVGVPLTVVGRAADPDYVRDRLEPAVRAARTEVRLTGPLPATGVARELARAELAFVTPDWEEPFGLTSVEALCCGTPVVAVARGGLAEILRGRTGAALVAPGPGLVDRLAAAARDVLEARPRAGGRALAEATAAEFSEARHLDALEAVYRRVLEGAPVGDAPTDGAPAGAGRHRVGLAR